MWYFFVDLFTPAKTTQRITTLVECGHRFVRRSRLHLHKISSLVAALFALNLSRIDVFPRGRTTHNIVNLFHFAVFSVGHFRAYVIHERTGVACETIRTRSFCLKYKYKQRSLNMIWFEES